VDVGGGGSEDLDVVRRRAVEFKKFLAKVDAEVSAELDVHLICDNYGTHKHAIVTKWLAEHPRFHMHFTPPTHRGGRAALRLRHRRPAPAQ
jgi:predicted transposase YbfD/YdcC